MNPPTLIIRKFVQVPTNEGSKHAYRTDAISVGRIERYNAHLFFKALNPQAPMTMDSQFAYWIYKIFGPGKFVVMAYVKGRKGVYVFMKLECTHDGFIRLAKYKSQEQKQKESQIVDYKRLVRSLKSVQSVEERQQIQEEIEGIKDELDFQKQLIDMDKSDKEGCYPFLKSTIPVYRFHAYENYGVQYEYPTEGEGFGNW